MGSPAPYPPPVGAIRREARRLHVQRRGAALRRMRTSRLAADGAHGRRIGGEGPRRRFVLDAELPCGSDAHTFGAVRVHDPCQK